MYSVLGNKNNIEVEMKFHNFFICLCTFLKTYLLLRMVKMKIYDVHVPLIYDRIHVYVNQTDHFKTTIIPKKWNRKVTLFTVCEPQVRKILQLCRMLVNSYYN